MHQYKKFFISAFLIIISMLFYGKVTSVPYDKRLQLFARYQDTVSLISKEIDETYLKDIVVALKKKWPDNHNINFVFHGHSVPSGYFKTPDVNTFESYPFLFLKRLTTKYPNSVINIIKTCKGGENSEQGALRFKNDVLTHKPDLIFIDYALNDIYIGLKRAGTAWEKMIRMGIRAKVKIILFTPTPDLSEDIKDLNSPLSKHALQIINLGRKYNIPVIDSYSKFRKLSENGQSLSGLMAQSNHINEEGHEIVAELMIKLF